MAEAGVVPSRLCALLRARADQIVARWVDRVAALHPGHPASSLVDGMPELLARVVDAVESLYRRGTLSLGELPRAHAVDRLSRGFHLEDVVREYALLRRSIYDVWEQEAGIAIDAAEVRALDAALDDAIERAASRFASARERSLAMLERVSRGALAADLDGFLDQLVQATLRSTDAADLALVLLREEGVGDVAGATTRSGGAQGSFGAPEPSPGSAPGTLAVRAAAGTDRADHPAIRVGRGFAGAVAAEGRPRSLRDAFADPDLGSEALRQRGVRALYGVPLTWEDQVMAVFLVGSTTAPEFTAEEQLLFRLAADRAATVIAQARAVAERERAHAERAVALARERVAREEAQRAMRDLAARELEFRALANNIAQQAWMADATGEIYWYNQRWFEYTGATLEETRGFGWKKLHHPDHLQRVMDKLRLALHTGSAWEDTFPLRGRDGRYRWFLGRAMPVRDEAGRVVRWFGTKTDITEQREAEQTERFLSEAAQVLSSTLDYRRALDEVARLAVPRLADWCVVDLAGSFGNQRTLTHSDPAKVELARELALRYPLVGDPRGPADVMRTREPELASDLTDEHLARYARDPDHLRVLRTLGLVSYLSVPMIARDRVVGAITLASGESGRRYDAADLDVAKRLASRAALAIDNARLYEEARAATRSREDVLAVVSHDLRNPLGTIRTTVGVLERVLPEDAAARRQVDAIRRAGERMEHLIGDLLDLASIQVGRLAVHPGEVEVGALLDEAIEAIGGAAQAKGTSVRAEPSACRAARLRCDRDRLLQVLGNLLGNAVKFSPAGASVVIDAKLAPSEVVVSVRDSGPGIPPTEAPHVFEPYWSASRQGRVGTGLGLYICRTIVEAHGGRIWVESQLGRGTTFHFTVPLAPGHGRR